MALWFIKKTPVLYDNYNTMNISLYIGPEGTKPQRTTIHFSDLEGKLYYGKCQGERKEI